MEIFDFNDKVNFIDENNVFVGFSTRIDCCENCFWWLCTDWTRAKKIDNCKKIIEGSISELNEKLKGFVFNTNFFRQYKGEDRFEEGGAVVFKLMKKNKRIFLILENHHNGYYSHGFELMDNDELIQDGYI